MKYVVEVKHFTTAPGKEYDATQYPGPGLYQNPTTMVWYLLYVMGGTTCVAMLGSGAVPPFPSAPYVEPTKVPEPVGITASDMLKAIAISQNPLLAKELLK